MVKGRPSTWPKGTECKVLATGRGKGISREANLLYVLKTTEALTMGMLQKTKPLTECFRLPSTKFGSFCVKASWSL